jgi:predicted PurR-regulated permease PerM
MKSFFKVVAWIAAAFVGLFIWNVTPDFRPIVTLLLAAAFICYVLSAIVEATIKRIIWDELLALRRQSDAAANHLALLDRKVTVILKDALEQRRLR